MESVTALRSLYIVFIVLFCALPTASPAPERSPSYLDEAVTALVDDVSPGFSDPWPAKVGLPPIPGFPTLLHLQKRQCLENGSNFCFQDDESRFCPGCGACCSLGSDNWCCTDGDAKCCPGKTCCDAGATCCGEGCCDKGRKCTNGKCEAPVVTTTTTSTKTVHTTRTHTEVEIVTVQMRVQVTSTINSVITETVTSVDGTHTEITYVTTTIKEQKRSLPTDAAYPRRRDVRNGDAARGGVFLSLWRRLVFGGHAQRPDFGERGLPASPIDPRHCPTTAFREVKRRQEDDGTSTITVFVTTTIESRTTVKDRRTTTNFITSTAETTIYQTSTRVIGARDTVSQTVTVTMTSKAPTTQTITSTSTSLIDPTDAPQTGEPSPTDVLVPIEETERKGLSTSAMTGIGVGSGVAALALGAVLVLLWRRSKKKKQQQMEVPYDYVIAPAPAPIPPRHRAMSDTAYGFTGNKVSPNASPPHSRGHSRSISAATTQVSSNMYGDPGARGSWVPPGAMAGVHGDAAARPQMRTIPHPNSSTVGRRTRFAELDA